MQNHQINNPARILKSAPIKFIISKLMLSSLDSILTLENEHNTNIYYCHEKQPKLCSFVQRYNMLLLEFIKMPLAQ